jgi:hypothetical protein
VDSFDNRLSLKIADLAHRKILDSVGRIGYPTTNTWLEAMKEVLKGEGYELTICCVIGSIATTTENEMPRKE